MPSAVELAKNHRSGRLNNETLTFIDDKAIIRPLRDQLLVEALDVMHSAVLIIPEAGKPVRGRVAAAGPGCWLKQYATGPRGNQVWHPTHHPPAKGERTAERDSRIFRKQK